MQITETRNEGLTREFKIVVEQTEIQKQIDAELILLGKRVKMPGFRPGKVPMTVLKKRYGSSVMGEVLQKTVANTSDKAVAERGLKPAMQPKIEVTSFALDGDLEYNMSIEVLPEIPELDLSKIKLQRPVADVTDEAVNDALKRLTQHQKSFETITEKRPAELGDVLTIDFKGSVDGESKPGMDGTDFDLELGSKSFIDTFETQLVGAQAGDHRTVNVTFPAEYHAKDLAGRAAVFEVDVKELKKAVPAELNDETAKKFGQENVEGLRKIVRDQIQREYDGLSRLKAKRALLDRLAEEYSFIVPQGMVDVEFDAIWQRVQEELKNAPEEEKTKGEDELKTEYRGIAERRVRLGLILNELGRGEKLHVSQEELQRALITEAQRYPGQERHILDYYRKTPHALEHLRAPIYEEKVVDFILGKINLEDRKVSPEELAIDPETDQDAL